ncbi:hypothetical protein [Eisenibacter elegans]|jgi:hypothetical protein|uniref:hypothetical protein n=1 Tax=Eisenibacter elegans TaxID=997 RepID=UPI0004232FAF|nr:hypothetical protein [Eisenibacter elegans]
MPLLGAWLVQLLAFVYRLFGADVTQVKAIVVAKLRSDGRRPQGGTFGAQQHSNQSFLTVLAVNALFGGIGSLLILVFPTLELSAGLFFAMLLFMLGMTLLSDFSAVLLDTTDNLILLPRPIHQKTLVAARFTHILLYIGSISAALSVIAFGVLCWRFGALVGLGFVLLVGLFVCFTVGVVIALYFVLIRYTSESTFKNAIMYLQISFAIVFTAGYQILPMLLPKNFDSQEAILQPAWWTLTLAPLWGGFLLDSLRSGLWTGYHYGYLGLLLGSLTAIWLIISSLSKKYTEMIATLGAESNDGATEQKPLQQGWYYRLGARLCRWPEMRMGFEFAWLITQRERRYKLQSYPLYGLFLVFVIVYFRDFEGTIQDMYDDIATSSKHLFLLYVGSSLCNMFYLNTQYSESYQASWIFESSPMYRPTLLRLGTAWAVFVKYVFPIFILLTFVLQFIMGAKVWMDTLFSLLVSAAALLVLVLNSNPRYPFSVNPKNAQDGSSAVIVFGGMILAGLAGLLHFALLQISAWAVPAATVVLGLIVLFLLRDVKKWDKPTTKR